MTEKQILFIVNIFHIEHVENVNAPCNEHEEQVLNEQFAEKTDAQKLRECIDKVLPLIQNKRHWFGVCKAIMEAGLVKKGSFEDASKLIRLAYPDGLKLEINVRDLVSLNCGSLTKSIPEWDEKNCGDMGKTFTNQKAIAMALLLLLKERFKGQTIEE